MRHENNKLQQAVEAEALKIDRMHATFQDGAEFVLSLDLLSKFCGWLNRNYEPAGYMTWRKKGINISNYEKRFVSKELVNIWLNNVYDGK